MQTDRAITAIKEGIELSRAEIKVRETLIREIDPDGTYITPSSELTIIEHRRRINWCKADVESKTQLLDNLQKLKNQTV